MKEWKKILPKDFFEKNKLKGPITASQLLVFQMDILYNDALNNEINEFIHPGLDTKRLSAMENEQKDIQNITLPEEMIRYMRKAIDPVNRALMCRHAIEMGDDLFDLLIDKLNRNGINYFIEAAMLSLSRAEERHIDRVANEFRQFRNSYARAQATALLAYRERTDALEEVYAEYCDQKSRDDRQVENILYSIYVLTGQPGKREEAYDKR